MLTYFWGNPAEREQCEIFDLQLERKRGFEQSILVSMQSRHKSDDGPHRFLPDSVTQGGFLVVSNQSEEIRLNVPNEYGSESNFCYVPISPWIVFVFGGQRPQ
jgi:hypothetical protein